MIQETPIEISDRVIAKVRKMLALAKAGSGATEAEATTAMAMANEILLRYNLTLSDLKTDRSEDGSGADRVAEGQIDFGTSPWKRELVNAVVKHNFCKVFERVYSEKGETIGYTLLGSATNVQITVMILEWLLDQVERVSKKEYAAYGANAGTWDEVFQRVVRREYISPTAWNKSFGQGCINRLQERLIEERERQNADTVVADQITALVISVESDIRDYLERKYPHRKEARLAREKQEAEFAQRREEQARWERENPEEAAEIRAKALALAEKRDAAAYAQDRKDATKRAKYEARYYRQHGHYPGEGRGRRTKYETTNYTAYERGSDAANGINLTPHLTEGKKDRVAELA